MKLLIVTQALDLDDPVLSAYHGWVAELARHADSVEAICLKEGRHALPENVQVHSLGKERGTKMPFVYAFRFLKLVWTLRTRYDVVFVHMNQEYLLIAGWLWKALHKRAYLWRNHYAGSFLTDIAAFFCEKVFCTSTHSYTAKYAKTVLMPVGVDTERFFPDESVARVPRSILFFARMSPSKRPSVLIDALSALHARGVSFTASFVGSPLAKDADFYNALRERVTRAGLDTVITFSPGVPNEQAPALYRSHDIFVNASPSGMLDKMIFEAAASGCLVLAASEDFMRATSATYSFSDVGMLTERLVEALGGDISRAPLAHVVARNSLQELGTKLAGAMLS